MGVAVALLALTRTTLFHARSVEVRGSARLSSAQVVALAGVDRRTNVPWLDEGAVERRLEQDPWIAHAEVRVAFPLTIEISVTERTPVGVAFGPQGATLVAADGTTLGPVGDVSTSELPRIILPAGGSADPAGAAAAIGRMSSSLRAKVDSVQVRTDGRLQVLMRAGVWVDIGPATALRSKARAIARALAWARSEGEQILTLSVIAPSAPAVELAPRT